MKLLPFLFLILLGMNISACNEEDETSSTDDYDIQREEEYKSSDIRDHELDID